MQELISIIMAAYNAEPFIGQAIESILAQTYENTELIIVNDASTDQTEIVCRHYSEKDKRIKIVSKTTNEGLAAARKTGVLHASGDYVGFVDADDTIEPDMYEQLLTIAKQYRADISHCGYTMILPDGQKKLFYGTQQTIEQSHEKGLIDLLEAKFVEPTTCTKLYKRSLFDGLQYVTEISINEDLMLNYLLFSKSQKSIYYDVCKYNYWKREGSMSRSVSIRHLTDPTFVKERIYSDSRSSESEAVQRAAGNRLVSQYIMNCFALKKGDFKEHKHLFGEYRNKLKSLYKTCDLSKNERVKMNIILYAPWLCKTVDRLYRRFS